MKFFILGTAGHIDHGKTALVKALTGIDADRLEKRSAHRYHGLDHGLGSRTWNRPPSPPL
jgi:selenocysteine-specific elongation factor